MPEPDPLRTLIEALEQQQPHAPITRAQVAAALRLLSDRLARLETRAALPEAFAHLTT